MPQIPPEAGAKKMATAMQCDLIDAHAVERMLLDNYPDAIINAAAASSPAAVDADPVAAELLNIVLPRQLAQFAFHLSARFLHISTDYVFDGEHGPYRSTDMPEPRSLYGQFKLSAEKEVLRYGGDFVVVLRITMVNGDSPAGNRGVHEKLFQAWAAGQVTPLYVDEFRQPVSAVNVGDVLTELLERPNLHGLFHWAGPDTLSRFEIGQAILKHFHLPENLIKAARLADQPDAHTRPRRLEFILPPLLGKLRAQPTQFALQLEELSVPPNCLDWYNKTRLNTGPDAGPGAVTRRLVQGRDF
jgi:dTDP-4-dehydrorhamnose reductase